MSPRSPVPPLSLLALAACVGAPARPEAMPSFGLAPATLPAPGWEVIGASLEGRPIEATTFGGGERRIYLIAGIHGDERPAVENAQRLHVFLEGETPADVTLRLVRDVNPDGTALGTRTNGRRVDLNRNWPASNFRPSPSRGGAPLSEPEVACVYADIERFRPELMIVLHAARRGPFANFDGPARDLAERFANGAAAVDPRWHVESEMGYATPGSLGSLVGVDRGIPVLTIELDRQQAADEAWPGLRAGLLALLHPTLSAPGDTTSAERYEVR